MTTKNMPLTMVFSTFLCATAMVSPGVAEFPVNTSAGAHEKAKVSLSAQNGFVVVWKDKSNKDVLARQFGNTGSAIGGEILVASSGDDEKDPDVRVADNGAFVVAWHNNTAKDIFAQRYDTFGSPVGGVILVTPPLPDVNFGFETIFGSSQGTVKEKQIATQVVLPEAGTVTSITAYIEGNNKKVRYAIYSDKNGKPNKRKAETASTPVSSGWAWQTIDLPDVALKAGTYWLALAFDRDTQEYCHNASGGQTRTANNDAVADGYTNPWGSSSSSSTRKISIYGTYLARIDNASPSVGMAVDGSFVVAWEEKIADDVFVQRYNADGSTLGATIQVAGSVDQETVPHVAVADDGSFVVAWQNKTAKDIFAQRYDAGGNALGGAIQVTSSSDDEKTPSLCVAEDGRFVVIWHNNTAKDIFAQRYDAAGIALGSAIQVTFSSDDEKDASLSVADDGTFVVAWENRTTKDVYLQRYDVDGIALGSSIQVTTSADQDKRPSVSVNPGGNFVVVWSNKVNKSTENILGQIYTSGGLPASEWQPGWRVMKWVEATAP